MNFWMPPRNTIDLDLMVSLEKRAVPALASGLNRSGFRFSKSLQRKLKEGRKIRLPIDDTELDLKLCRTEHDRRALERAQDFRSEELSLRIALPEDLILYKLQAWRRLDQADIERLHRECEGLDEEYIVTWLARLEASTGVPMQERWKEIRG